MLVLNWYKKMEWFLDPYEFGNLFILQLFCKCYPWHFFLSSLCAFWHICVYWFSTKVSSIKCSSWLVLSHLSMSPYHSKIADLCLASPCFAKAGKYFQVVKQRNSRVRLFCWLSSKLVFLYCQLANVLKQLFLTFFFPIFYLLE